MIQANPMEPANRASASKSRATAWRIHFAPSAPAGAKVLAQFTDPHPGFAVAQEMDPDALADASAWPEPMDQLDILICPASADSGLSAAWLAPPDHPDAPLPLAVALSGFGRHGGKLTWRPGRALLEAASFDDQTLCAIAEFSFYEAELRRLEEAVRPLEASALQDAAKAYRMNSKTLGQRDQFGQIIESLALLRLTFVRLEPRLLTPSRRLPPPTRRLIRQLSRRAAIEDRLSAITDRLEACEDLYEGAVDRMTDHRWYRRENLLEIIIIALLLIEVIQLAADMAMRWAGEHAR